MAYTPVYTKHIKPSVKFTDIEKVMLDGHDKVKQFLKDVMSIPAENRILAVDTETSDLNHLTARLVGMSFCYSPTKAYYMPVGHNMGGNYEQFEEIKPYLCKLLYSCKKVLFYGARFDLRILERNIGLDIDKVSYYDIMTLVWNFDSNVKKLNLKDAVMKGMLKWEGVEKFKDVTGKNKDASYTFPEKMFNYASADAAATYLAYNLLTEYAPIYDVIKNINSIDNAILRPVKLLEEGIIPMNKELLESYMPSIRQRIVECEKAVYAEIGNKINLGSHKQLLETFQQLGIDTGKKTNKGKGNSMSLDEKALLPLAKDYPFVSALLELRKQEKLLSTYIEEPLRFMREYNLHGCRFAYKTAGVTTGRLAGGSDSANSFFSSMPQQGLPKTKEVRYVVTDTGNIFGHGYQQVGEHDEYDYEGQTLEHSIRHCLTANPEHLWFHVDFCLSGDTEVTLSDGTTRTIQHIVDGNERLFVKTPIGNKEIIGKSISSHSKYLRIELDNGIVLKCSENHKFFVVDKSDWVEARYISVGNSFVGEDNKNIEVLSITLHNTPVTLYDITVKDAHCFFANGILAHNCGQEARIMANMAGGTMLDILKSGLDLHTETAKLIFGDEYYENKSKCRKKAKCINFATMYGGGWPTISQQLGISKEEAEELIAKWWSAYKHVRILIDKEIQFAKKKGYCRTHFGRIRWVHEDLADRKKYGYALRTITNSPIQGTGADVSKIAMQRIYERVIRKFPATDIQMMLMVHDEFNFSITQDRQKFEDIVREIKSCVELRVKGWELVMGGDMSVGTTFADGIPLEVRDDGLFLCDKYKI